MRKALADSVSRSFHNIPQFDIHMDVNASMIVRERTAHKNKKGKGAPSYNDMIILCAGKALAGHPETNAHITNERIKLFKEINIGFAVAAPDGVFLPVIRRANTRNLHEIAEQSAELIKAARNSRLRSYLQMLETLTVSSLGESGIDSFNAIINPPQVAALAVGTVIKKSWCMEDKILSLPTHHLTLTVDHPVIDGACAAEFLFDLSKTMGDFQS
ncbi:MAG: 2-oxo acid dehydrogenase subunit E2 [Candidatus Aminicenantales bacterium]